VIIMKKKKVQQKGAIAVEGHILPTLVFDMSAGIDDLEEWTRGPILPVGADQPTAKNGKSRAKPRKKKT
jgi:hypothetical protein